MALSGVRDRHLGATDGKRSQHEGCPACLDSRYQQDGPGQSQHALCESPGCHYEMMAKPRVEKKGTRPPAELGLCFKHEAATIPLRRTREGNPSANSVAKIALLTPNHRTLEQCGREIDALERYFLIQKYHCPTCVARVKEGVRKYHCERFRQRKIDKDNPPTDGLCTYFGGGHCKTASFYWDAQKRRWLCEKHANPTYLAREKRKRALREKNRNTRPAHCSYKNTCKKTKIAWNEERGKWYCKEHFVNKSTIELADKREQNRDKPTASCAQSKGCKAKPTVWNEELGVWHCAGHATQVGSSTRKAKLDISSA
ncbi:hypothetical protein BDZ85DRAFT_296465 [Elsinoe ampelina]|uniref:Uncharacterized protein n=1 Tax=Elsinoe ampelina TaxID=302913 RepID=A0A6A6GA81_9PEZI|nr:hypothetical protein BDZ85DRAFT_296465 [Elsinoe ampelina]